MRQRRAFQSVSKWERERESCRRTTWISASAYQTVTAGGRSPKGPQTRWGQSPLKSNNVSETPGGNCADTLQGLCVYIWRKPVIDTLLTANVAAMKSPSSVGWWNTSLSQHSDMCGGKQRGSRENIHKTGLYGDRSLWSVSKAVCTAWGNVYFPLNLTAEMKRRLITKLPTRKVYTADEECAVGVDPFKQNASVSLSNLRYSRRWPI